MCETSKCAIIREINDFTTIKNSSKKRSIKKVIIKEPIKAIPKNAFIDFSSLEEVILPKTIKYISYNAFKDCYKLYKINLEDTNCELIGVSAFENTGLEYIRLPQTMRRIFGKAFYKSTLSAIHINNDLQTIYNNAFSYTNLITVSFSSNTSVKNDAFNNCKSLLQVTIRRHGENKNNISKDAFIGCDKVYIYR